MAAGTHSVRGTRVGSGPAGDDARGGSVAPSRAVSYWCGAGHETSVRFAVADDVEIPTVWVCQRCGAQAGTERDAPPATTTAQVFKTHLEYVKERRDDAAGAALLDEALTALRERRVLS